MRERPLVGLDMVDPDNPLHWLSVRGKIAEITEERAFEHVKKLAKKYTGNDLLPPSQPDEVLVIVNITPVLYAEPSASLISGLGSRQGQVGTSHIIQKLSQT